MAWWLSRQRDRNISQTGAAKVPQDASPLGAPVCWNPFFSHQFVVSPTKHTFAFPTNEPLSTAAFIRPPESVWKPANDLITYRPRPLGQDWVSIRFHLMYHCIMQSVPVPATRYFTPCLSIVLTLTWAAFSLLFGCKILVGQLVGEPKQSEAATLTLAPQPYGPGVV